MGFLEELFGLVIRLNLVPLLARSVLVPADLANVEIYCYFLFDLGGQLLQSVDLLHEVLDVLVGFCSQRLHLLGEHLLDDILLLICLVDNSEFHVEATYLR